MSLVSDNEKSHILRVIALGVDLYTACIQAHLSLDQIEALEEDQSFADECDYIAKKEELRLLTLYSKTVDKAAEIKLDHKGIRDRLELINPSRYSKNAKEAKEDHNTVAKIERTYKIPDNGRGK